jgi:Glycosyl transferase family 2
VANTDRAASERAPDRFALSILIPVYNGAGRIRRLVRALEELAIEEDGHEIQLVDDGSRDNSLGQVTFNPQSEGLGRAPLTELILSQSRPRGPLPLPALFYRR